MTTNTRTLGAVTRVLDAETLLAAARVAFTRQYPGEDAARLTHGPLPQMIFAVDRGKSAAIVNTEGVGNIENEDDTIDVCFSHCMSRITVTLTLEEVANAISDETIDLADGIRTFGDRLEVNFHTWRSKYHSYN